VLYLDKHIVDGSVSLAGNGKLSSFSVAQTTARAHTSFTSPVAVDIGKETGITPEDAVETLRQLGLWRVDDQPLSEGAGAASSTGGGVITIGVDETEIRDLALAARSRRLLELGERKKRLSRLKSATVSLAHRRSTLFLIHLAHTLVFFFDTCFVDPQKLRWTPHDQHAFRQSHSASPDAV
jgi:hypothetical protein